MRLFRRQGYAATGVQQVITEAGAPKGSLYHYFPGGKEALAEAAIERAGELILVELRAAASRTETPHDFLSDYCTTLGRWMREGMFSSGSPITTILLECTPQNEAISRAGQRVHESWIDVICRVYRDDGFAEADARSKADLALAAIEGALILSRLRQSEAPLAALPSLLAAPRT